MKGKSPEPAVVAPAETDVPAACVETAARKRRLDAMRDLLRSFAAFER